MILVAQFLAWFSHSLKYSYKEGHTTPAKPPMDSQVSPIETFTSQTPLSSRHFLPTQTLLPTALLATQQTKRNKVTSQNCLKIKVGGTNYTGASRQVISYTNGCMDSWYDIKQLLMALEAHVSLYTAELGLLVCGGRDKREFQQDVCYTYKFSDQTWEHFGHTTKYRVNACIQQIGYDDLMTVVVIPKTSQDAISPWKY